MTTTKGRHRQRPKRAPLPPGERAKQAGDAVARSLQAAPLPLPAVERMCKSWGSTVKRVWGWLGRKFGKRVTVKTFRGVEVWSLDRYKEKTR